MKKFFNEEGAEVSLSYEDVLEWLKNAISNNSVTVEKLVADIGMENKLRTKNDVEMEALVSDLEEALDLPPDTPIKEVIVAVEEALDELKAAEESVVEAAANELAEGKKLKSADGTERDNPVYIYAKNALKGKRGKQLNKAVEALKEDPVMTELRSKQADTRVTAVDGVIKPGNVIREV